MRKRRPSTLELLFRKNRSRKKLEALARRLWRKLNVTVKKERTYTVHDVRHSFAHEVNVDAIVYLKANGNTTLVFEDDGGVLHSYYVSCNLKAAMKELHDKKFLLIHRSYAVHLKHIAGILQGRSMKVKLRPDVTVPVARKHRKELLERYGGDRKR